MKKNKILLIIFSLVFINIFSKGLERFDGKTFQKPGPNCFGTALFALGYVPSFRGVGKNEFEGHLLKFCKEVKVANKGSMGVFYNDLGAIHSFYYLTKDIVFEKTGVDYAGATPVQVRSIEHTMFTFEVDPLCRQYSQNIEECKNDLKIYNCEKKVDILENQEELKRIGNKIEEGFRSILNGNETDLIALKQNINNYSAIIISLGNELPYYDLLIARVESYEKQYLFLK